VHEKRNFTLVIVLIASVIWAIVAWFILPTQSALLWPQRIISIALILGSAAWLFYALRVEDKLPDHLSDTLGEHYYYEADGLCFMPTIRAKGEQAELSLFYQNRFENPVEAVVHLRPPEQSFVIRPGWRDVHIAFKADGGDFGVIHQPISVPRDIQGDVIEVKLAAASYYPRSQGSRLRRRPGMPCGSLVVDWVGSQFKSGVHQVTGEIVLQSPATLRLSLPAGVHETADGREVWKQERIVAGVRS
jgi:hypothetical protein